MNCPKCNFQNKENSKFCEQCGYPLPTQNPIPPVPPVPPEPKRKKPWYTRWWIWVLMGIGTIFLLFCSTCTCAMFMPESLKSTPDSVAKQAESQSVKPTEKPTEKEKPAEKEKPTEKPTEKEMTSEEIINQIVNSGFEEVSASVLYNHYEDYKDKKVVTAILVTDTAYKTLYSDIDNDGSSSELYFSFDKSSDMNEAKEGSYAIVFGVGDEISTFGSHKKFKNCYVAATGEQAKIEYDKLAREALNAEKKKQAEAEEKVKKEKEDYIKSCKTIDYKTLSRNPDKYKGEHFKLTGQVIQVLDSDSWFSDATTLRINITKHDNEYVDDWWEDTIVATVVIPKGADRILENDIITFYGDCDGLYTYTSVLKQKISLPKIDIKYFEVN